MGFRYKSRSSMLLVVIMLSMLQPGCRQGISGNGTVMGTPPPAAELLHHHNQRVSRLRQLDAAGVLEIVWVDENNRRRREQGDVELWIDQPWRTAMRVSKLGEDLMWLGSNEQRYWLFDLLDKNRRVLITQPHEIALIWGSGDGALQLQPLVLLDLMGITPVQPLDDDDDALVQADASRRQWVIDVQGRSGPLRMRFDAAANRLVAIALLDDQDAHLLTSQLSRYEPVDVIDEVAFERPQIATLIDIVEPAGRASFKLALSSQLFGDLTDQPVESMFNLAPLLDRYRPHETRDASDPDHSAPPSGPAMRHRASDPDFD